MARLLEGILGGFSGKVGTVVGFSRNGKQFMKSRPKPRTGAPTANELANRQKFAATQSWLKPITGFVRVGFRTYSNSGHGFNSAKSYLSKNALAGTTPDFYIDPIKALVSWGDLPGCENPEARSEAENTVTFYWEADLQDSERKNDHVMMLAYDIEGSLASFTTSGAKRKAGTDSLEVPDAFSGREVDVYIAFISEERAEMSMSQYLGKVLVQ